MITFTISALEESRIKEWQTEHNLKCKLRKRNKPASYSYIFIPTGIGNVIEVKCACGKSIDVTDVDNW